MTTGVGLLCAITLHVILEHTAILAEDSALWLDKNV